MSDVPVMSPEALAALTTEVIIGCVAKGSSRPDINRAITLALNAGYALGFQEGEAKAPADEPPLPPAVARRVRALATGGMTVPQLQDHFGKGLSAIRAALKMKD